MTLTSGPPVTATLSLDRVGDDVFQTRHAHLLASADVRGDQPSQAGDRRRVYGGQLLAQAVAAATHTVPSERPCHSVHASFVAGPDPTRPIEYTVERLRDGGSVSHRRVAGRQGDREIVAALVSFHTGGTGLEHQDSPSGTQHDELPLAVGEASHAWSGIELKFGPVPAPPPSVDATRGTRRVAPWQVWMRVAEPLGDDDATHRCALAYASDLALIRTALLPHGTSAAGGRVRLASLDHTLWFHRPTRADRWLLLECTSPVAADSRALALASIFDETGVLVATVAQEGMVRLLA